MSRRAVLTVPGTVPDPQVTRLPRQEPQRPIRVCADPCPVPTAHTRKIFPEQLTLEQVEQLRAENQALREELQRVRSR